MRNAWLRRLKMSTSVIAIVTQTTKTSVIASATRTMNTLVIGSALRTMNTLVIAIATRTTNTSVIATAIRMRSIWLRRSIASLTLLRSISSLMPSQLGSTVDVIFYITHGVVKPKPLMGQTISTTRLRRRLKTSLMPCRLWSSSSIRTSGRFFKHPHLAFIGGRTHAGVLLAPALGIAANSRSAPRAPNDAGEAVRIGMTNASAAGGGFWVTLQI